MSLSAPAPALAALVLTLLAGTAPTCSAVAARSWLDRRRAQSSAVETESAAQTPYRQALHNFLRQDLQYTADVVVGNQALQGVLDTGSFEVLVFSKACSDCGEPTSLYSSTASTTFRRGLYMTSHAFGSGVARSLEGFERITLGPLVAGNMSFWEVYDVNMPVVAQSDFQAIVGVGPPGVPESTAWQVVARDQRMLQRLASAAEQAPPPLRQFAVNRSNQLRKLVNESIEAAVYTSKKNDSLLEVLNVTSFSVCLGKEPGSDGSFVWHDDAHLLKPSSFMHLPVVGGHTWSVEMHGVHLGSGRSGAYSTSPLACENGCGAILDSGTSLLVMPSAAAARISDALEAGGATCDSNLGVSGLPHLHFQLGQHNFSLPPEAYLGTAIGEAPAHMSAWWSKDTQRVILCGLQLTVMTQEAETQLGPMWILGMPLFRQYYVNFNLGGNVSANIRSMNLALAGPNLEPADLPRTALISGQQARIVDAAGESAPMASEAEVPRFRTVDASKLRVPRWASQAFSEGAVSI